MDFVTRVTRPGGPDFVPLAERIATFDNDGTLWAEQPTTSSSRPWSTGSRRSRRSIRNGETESLTEPVLDGDLEAIAASGEKGGSNSWYHACRMTTDESFDDRVRPGDARASIRLEARFMGLVHHTDAELRSPT